MKFTAVATLFAVATSTTGASAFAPAVGRFAARPLAAALYSVATEQSGEAATESFRLNFKGEDGAAISPWHDIPLKGDGGYNMVVEIPKMTKAKMEVATKEANNPIAQDIKKGNLRDYHGPIFWNYGCLPQTWEDPNGELMQSADKQFAVRVGIYARDEGCAVNVLESLHDVKSRHIT
jgi:hypothetical protein